MFRFSLYGIIFFISIFLFSFSVHSSDNENSCWTYNSKKMKSITYKNCYTKQNDKFIWSNVLLKNLDYHFNDLDFIYINQDVFYLNKKGKYIRTIIYDNGPDEFSEGLVRSIDNNKKMGFYNMQLDLIIPHQFDWAWPFKEGKSQVCMGCTIGKPDDHGHRALQGGEWFFVDKQGQRIP